MDNGAYVQNMMSLMNARVDAIAHSLDYQQIDNFINGLLEAKRIFIMGAGRSGLVAKSFAMRLMHTGFTSYVVGETITPAIDKGDLFIAVSGSGGTKTIADLAETAKSLDAKVALITSNPDSRIGHIADYVVKIDARRETDEPDSHEYEIRQILGQYRSFAPLGTLFETSALIFGDALISTIMQMKDIEERDLKRRHTNIE
ncbi:MAG TPA: 6-phospho-3-hexuloisomerase [Methanocorpusculum sp.]|nr:6-phospho-3-hexuloisomerase [Methanocorpusculum sp.]